MMDPSEFINMVRVITCLSHECFLCRIAVVDRIVIRPVCAKAPMATTAFSPGTYTRILLFSLVNK